MDKKGTHSVKFLTEKLTTFGKLTSGQVNEWTSWRVDKLASGQVDEWISERVNRSFPVTRKVRFLAMTMFEQARHCSFGLAKTFIFAYCDLNTSILT